jgi:hypothetical protein
MNRLDQFRLNARCLARTLATRRWSKAPHFLRGLWRAVTSSVLHDPAGSLALLLARNAR